MRSALFILVLAFLLPAVSCGRKADSAGQGEEESSNGIPDTLRVATLYSPTSFFIYRDQEMGYDYTLVKAFADDKGLVIDLQVATSLADALARLDSGFVDLVAYEVPVTSEYQDRVLHCGPSNTTSQVLVQPLVNGAPAIRDVTDLVGRDVYVEEDSKYSQRMSNLNEELGGGIIIHPVNKDTLITEDLIAMVSAGEIPLTVVDSDIARINKTYFRDLDINLLVGFPQRSSWAVRPTNTALADTIDSWIAAETPRQENRQLLKRYFELSKSIPSAYTIDFSRGTVSQYDDLFRRYAPTADLDWRLLAAQAFVESRFNNDVESWSGAKGLMQIMPSTARAYHVDPSTLTTPEVSIELATRIMHELDSRLESKVPDHSERVKFIIAAYNSGLAHVYDAIELAKVTGKDPHVWSGNVEEAMLLKSNPEYFNLPVCRFGYFRGRQTVEYVREVTDFYDRVKQHIPS